MPKYDAFNLITKSVNTLKVWYYDFYSELLKAEVMRTHVCTNCLRMCAKFVLLNAKQENKHLKKNDVATSLKNLKIFTCFYGILGPFLCSKLSVRQIGWAK